MEREENSPVKVEFVSYQCKKIIFENIKQLKNKDVAIANDLTLKQRQDFQRLKTFLREARSKYSEKSYLKGDKLMIGKRSYTLEELKNSSGEVTKGNSAPNTPTLSYEIVEEKGYEEGNNLMSEEEKGESAIREKNKKIHNTPHLPTHKKFFSKGSKPPIKEKNTGMKLRQK